MKQRIYIDTSVIGGCYDEEFEIWSNHLIDEFKIGLKIAIVSDITYRELELAPERVQKVLSRIPIDHIHEIETTGETEELAEKYIAEGAIVEKFYEDALHIANATVEEVHVLASWNFKHIVNLDSIRKYNGVNLKNGYKTIEIRTPREILKSNENEN
ncbi:MAG: hypothetical protein R6U46_02460 [Marinilabilia sp.]